MVLPGALALSLYPSLSSGDQVFPTLVKELLPVGLRGLVLAALLAAIMSTIDSTINAASALVHYDFLHPNHSPRVDFRSNENQPNGAANLPKARLLTVLFMVLAIVWAPVIQGFPGLFAYLQQMFAVAVPPFVVVYCLGLGWRGATTESAWWCLLVGHGLGIGFVVATQYGLWGLHFLETAGITTLICLGVQWLVSLNTARQDKPRQGRTEDGVLLWSRSMLPMSRSYDLWKDYRSHLTVLLAVTTLMVLIFF
jgi:SSS family solute:Na+ symporter